MAATPKAEAPVAWPSPITSDLLTAASTPRSEAAWGADGALWWVEGRPSEGGRSVLVRRDVLGGGAAADVTPPVPKAGGSEGDSPPPAFNVRTRVHEYGGGAAVLLPGEAPGSTRAVFSNFADSRLYSQTVPAGWDGATPLPPPTPLTRAGAGLRFSDGAADPAVPGRALFVVEDHGVPGRPPTDPESYLAAVDLSTGALTRLTHCAAADGAGAPRSDFVSTPRLSPDGAALAWVAWDHPSMPWGETSLWVARLGADGRLADARRVAGGAGRGESVMEPVWVGGATNAGAGGLAFISDRTDWWSLYFISLGDQGEDGGTTPLPLPAEGAGDAGAPGLAHLTPGPGEWAGPQWILGLRQLQWVPGSPATPGRLLARWADPGRAGAQAVFVSTAGERAPIPSSFTGFGRLAVRQADPARPASITLATVGASLDRPADLATLEISTDTWAPAGGGGGGAWAVHATAADVDLDPGFISRPLVLEFPTDPLPGDDPATAPPRTAFLNYYPPAHPDHALPAAAPAPPCLFRIHGGPTAQSPAAFSLGTLYWTSRGFAVADVNYGGSTGYGRAFRARLNGNWGLVDVADVAAAAKHLAAEGLADAGRCCITGGSAGGFTVMAALAFRPGVFAAGTSHYGVADCSLLAAETVRDGKGKKKEGGGAPLAPRARAHPSATHSFSRSLSPLVRPFPSSPQHKFESKYLDTLIAPYPAGEAVYAARSPINSLDKVAAPLALFQGADDKVVPPNQAENAFKILAGRGIPTTLVVFEGEGHGFRGAAAVRSALDGELFFYGRTLGFPTGDFPAGLTKPDIVNAPPESAAA